MSHDDLVLLLQSIQGDVQDTKKATVDGFEKLNNRLRKAETHIAVLRLAVFGVGTGMLGALGYLFVRLMTP